MNNSVKKILANFMAFAFFFFLINDLMAQRFVTGTIKDDEGRALVGVTVFLNGTNIGTTTDVDGRYLINLPADQEEIILSVNRTGYTSYQFDAKSFVLGEGNVDGFSVSVEFGETCADGYKIQFHRTYQALLIPLQGRNRILVKSIKKKKLREKYRSQLTAIENKIETKLGKLWYCLENDDPCNINIRENYQTINNQLRDYSNFLKSAREQINNKKPVPEVLLDLNNYQSTIDSLIIYNCSNN